MIRDGGKTLKKVCGYEKKKKKKTSLITIWYGRMKKEINIKK